MAIPFQPPEGLIQSYLNRPQPAELANQGIQQALQTYLASKNNSAKRQQEKLDGYIKAFDAGGPNFAQDYAKRVGLKNAPALPGTTPATSAMGTAGVTPSLDPMNPLPAAQPATPEGLFMTDNGMMHPEAPPDMSSPIIAHWNNTVAGQQQPGPQAPAPAPSPIPVPQIPTAPAGIPGMENPEQFLNMGAYGAKRLQAGEALGGYKAKMQDAYEKDLASAPRSANQLIQDFALAGKPEKAQDWIRAHAPNAMDNPDQPLINVAQVKEAKDWLATGAMQQRSSYFDVMGNVQTQKMREGLIKEARTTLDPYFQTGEGRAQAQRLNSIGRTEPLIDQMLSQKGGGDPRQMRELATRIDSVLKGSPGGVQAVEGINSLVPQTARGKFTSWLEWFTNDPHGTEQQAFIHRYADTLQREKNQIQSQVGQVIDRTAPTLRVLKDQFPQDYDAVVKPYISGKHEQLTGANVPTIASDEDFAALPSGAKFKDPTGTVHTKN